MIIYYVVLFLLMLNGLLAKGNRKRYIVSSFLLLIIIASLRDYTVGKDLMGHYARNYMTISRLGWGDLAIFTGSGRYDIGFVILCKLLSYISPDPQFFIVVTSILIFAFVGRYIYWQSDDPVLETILFYCMFLYFMYYTMIAQAIAIVIVMFALEFLPSKKYAMYVILVLLATAIHSSAIVCLLFIPVSKLQTKRKNIFWFVTALGAFILLFDRIVDWSINTVFSDYEFHLAAGNTEGVGYGFSFFDIGKLIIYLSGIIIVLVYAYLNKKPDVGTLKRSIKRSKNSYAVIEVLSTIFYSIWR